MPIFIEGGSFLPLTNPLMTTDTYNTDTLLIWYYPDNENPNTDFTIYVDDGLSASSIENESYELIHLNGLVGDDIIIDIEKEGSGFSGSPDNREMMFELKRINNEPLLVLLNNSEVDIVDNESDYYNTAEAAYFDVETEILMIHFLWDGLPSQIEINGTGVGVDEFVPQTPKDFVLNNPFPNPFSSSVNLNLDVIKSANYYLSIHDIYGKNIYSTSLGNLSKGRTTISWDGNDYNGNTMSNGTYIFNIRSEGGERAIQKVMLMRE